MLERVETSLPTRQPSAPFSSVGRSHCVQDTTWSIYRLDAESRKLRELESRGGLELPALERSDDATKGPPRRSNARSFHDEASNRFRAMVTQTKRALEKWRQASISSERLSATGLKNQIAMRLSLSLLLAASDERVTMATHGPRWRNGDRLRYLRRDASCSCHFQLQRVA